MKGKIFNAQEVQAILSGSKVMFREVIKYPANWEELGTWDVKCPYQVGQKIFVKEDFFGCPIYHKDAIFSARYMKQEHSRLTLLIKEIRVERLEDISDKDLLKEGMQITDEWTAPAGDLDFENENMDAFKNNWNATHKKPEEKFEASPFVWVCTMEVLK